MEDDVEPPRPINEGGTSGSRQYQSNWYGSVLPCQHARKYEHQSNRVGLEGDWREGGQYEDHRSSRGLKK